MKLAKGMVLIITLVLLLIMTLMVSALLILSQLSHKSAYAGQQQLQLSQQAMRQHLEQVAGLQYGDVDNVRVIAECPAQYAAWSAGALHCEMLQLETQSYSDNQQFYAGYSSLLLKQRLQAAREE
jgi:type II secretory pathway pseudopilin PulG